MPLRILHSFINGCLFLALAFLLIIHRTSAGLYNYANQGRAIYQNGNSNYLMTNSGSIEMSLDEIYHSSGERGKRKRSAEMEKSEEGELRGTDGLGERRIRGKRRCGRKPPSEVPVDLWEEGAEAEMD